MTCTGLAGWTVGDAGDGDDEDNTDDDDEDEHGYFCIVLPSVHTGLRAVQLDPAWAAMGRARRVLI